jgi:hypothetical protein
MKTPTVRSAFPRVLLIAVVASLAACEDSRIRALDEGIPRDSALALLGATPPENDPEIKVYRHNEYYIDNKLYEVWYFDPEGRRELDEIVPENKLTPVVIVDGKVAGWGRSYLRKLADEKKIPVPASR